MGRRYNPSARVSPTRSSGRALAITASMSDPIEPVRIEEILAIARRHVVERVRLFGSLARGEAPDE